MSDSYEREPDPTRTAGPKPVKVDPVGLLLGGVLIALGIPLLHLGHPAFGVLTIVVGGSGVLAGGAPLVSRSPKVKLLQVLDYFFMALFAFFLAMRATVDGLSDGLFGILAWLAIAAFFVWAGHGDLKEYRQLRENARAGLQAGPPTGENGGTTR